jgi:Flp pilus assembly protein TadG
VNSRVRHRQRTRGATLVEFSLVAFLLCLLLFACIEFDRMALVYVGVANSARTGARYAIVHGYSRTGSGPDGPSGPANTAQVLTVVRNFAGAAILNVSTLNIAVNYPDGSNTPGSRVSVTVVYPYDPFTVLPLRVNIRSSSTGIIAF